VGAGTSGKPIATSLSMRLPTREPCAIAAVAGWLVASHGVLSAQSQRASKPIYVVPMGVRDAVGRVHSTAEYFREALGLNVIVAPDVEPSPTAYDSQRQQFIAERILEQLEDVRRRLSPDSSATTIGVTSLDVYAAEITHWRFVFSYRGTSTAIVSYARMDPRNLGQSPNEDCLQARLRKMVAKNIGVLSYGLPLTVDPRSLLYNSILGLAELDFIEEDFARAGMAPVRR
jgi:predicted Zn-dependent protease